MELIHKLEVALVAQYDKLPHLPENIQKWLADNAWWLVLIGVATSAVAILGVLSIVMIALFGLSFGGALVGAGVGAAIGSAIGGVILIVTVLSLALYVVQTALLGMAISPLKSLKKRGWDLVFIVAVINAAVIVISNVLTVNFVGLIWSLLWVAVGVYFLYEIREYFLVKKIAPKKHAKGIEAEAKL